jgi:hypothetical protein
MLQTRSADEATTQFYRCTKCGHTWRNYSWRTEPQILPLCNTTDNWLSGTIGSHLDVSPSSMTPNL